MLSCIQTHIYTCVCVWVYVCVGTIKCIFCTCGRAQAHLAWPQWGWVFACWHLLKADTRCRKCNLCFGKCARIFDQLCMCIFMSMDVEENVSWTLVHFYALANHYMCMKFSKFAAMRLQRRHVFPFLFL